VEISHGQQWTVTAHLQLTNSRTNWLLVSLLVGWIAVGLRRHSHSWLQVLLRTLTKIFVLFYSRMCLEVGPPFWAGGRLFFLCMWYVCCTMVLTHWQTFKLLLAFSSIVSLGSKSYGSHDHFLLSDGSGCIETTHLFTHSQKKTTVMCMCVTIDGVWIGDWIYWPLTHTTQNYKQLLHRC
jgi:hypothetical protein